MYALDNVDNSEQPLMAENKTNNDNIIFFYSTIPKVSLLMALYSIIVTTILLSFKRR